MTILKKKIWIQHIKTADYNIFKYTGQNRFLNSKFSYQNVHIINTFNLIL